MKSTRNRFSRVLWCFVLCLAMGAASAHAHSFYSVSPSEPMARTVAGPAWNVDVDFDRLLGFPRTLSMEMPDGLEFDVRRTGFERRSAVSGTWVGRISDDPLSRAIVSVENGAAAGIVHTRYGTYSLEPGAGGGHVLRLQTDESEPCRAVLPEADEQQPRSLPDARQDQYQPVARDHGSDPQHVIDLLVVYTRDAEDRAGGRPAVLARVRLGVDYLNTVLGDSDLPHRVRLVRTSRVGLYETDDYLDNLYRLRSDGQVAELRDRYKADLVSVVLSQAGGSAWVMTRIYHGFERNAFSSVNFSSLPYRLAHVVGHNMGFQHEPGGSEYGGLFSFSHGHSADGSTTVMACCGRIVTNYSNPEVEVDGFVTGIANERDNARTLHFTDSWVANFRRSGILFADEFEGALASGWSGRPGALEVATPGLDGSSGALAVPLDGSGRRSFLTHRNPASGGALHLQFTISPNRATLGASGTNILALLGRGKRHLEATLSLEGGVYWLTVVAKGDQGPYRQVGRARLRPRLTDRIRIEWRQSSAPGANDGAVRLFKNDNPQGSISNLDNDQRLAKEVRIGLPSGSAGALSTRPVLLDDYSASLP